MSSTSHTAYQLIVAEALRVADFERRHPSNAAFGQAMRAAGLNYGYQDRAALLQIARLVEQRDAEQVSVLIRYCGYSSPQHVWARGLANMSKTSVSNTAPRPTTGAGWPVSNTPLVMLVTARGAAAAP